MPTVENINHARLLLLHFLSQVGQLEAMHVMRQALEVLDGVPLGDDHVAAVAQIPSPAFEPIASSPGMDVKSTDAVEGEGDKGGEHGDDHGGTEKPAKPARHSKA